MKKLIPIFIIILGIWSCAKIYPDCLCLDCCTKVDTIILSDLIVGQWYYHPFKQTIHEFDNENNYFVKEFDLNGMPTNTTTSKYEVINDLLVVHGYRNENFVDGTVTENEHYSLIHILEIGQFFMVLRYSHQDNWNIYERMN